MVRPEKPISIDHENSCNESMTNLDLGSAYLTLEEALQTVQNGQESELFELKIKAGKTQE